MDRNKEHIVLGVGGYSVTGTEFPYYILFNYGCEFLERTQILSGIQFTTHFIQFVFVETDKEMCDLLPINGNNKLETTIHQNDFDEMLCGLDFTDNSRLFEKYPTLD